jgi:hypothetical protein
LQSAVTRLGEIDGRSGGHRLDLCIAELPRNVFGQRSSEKNRKEATECGCDSRQKNLFLFLLRITAAINNHGLFERLGCEN